MYYADMLLNNPRSTIFSQRLTFFSHPGFEAFSQTAVSALIALVLVNDTVS